MEQIKDLSDIRKNIDALDDELSKLFIKRMALSEQVAAFKKSTARPVRDSAREDAIVERLSKGQSQKDTDALKLLYGTVFELSRSRQSMLLAENNADGDGGIEKRITDAYNARSEHFPNGAVIACQGVEGAYSQIACSKIFNNPHIMYFDNFESVFKSVQSGLCRYGVLPFENSIHGSVTEVYDMLASSDVSVCKSVKLPIHHALLAKKGVSLSEITEIYSHRQAIGQCSDFLNANRKIKVNICENTAMAARMVAGSSDKGIAAISSEACASLYGLDVLKKDLQNSGVNFTMFYCITKKLEIYGDVKKSAFMFNIPNRSGSLFSVLSRFAVNGINLTKIESRPISGKDFEFMFYAEADADGLDKSLLRLFGEFEKTLDFFRFIGAYDEFSPENTNVPV